MRSPNVLIAGIIAILLALFAFEATCSKSWDVETGPLTFYNSLTDALLRGELFLFEAPVSITQLKDPYEPVEHRSVVEAHSYWDLSLYQGKFFLYFGIAPALALFLPYKILTGGTLPAVVAIFIFCSGALVIAAFALLQVIRAQERLGRLSLIAILPPFLMLGLGSMAGLLLKRAYMYEVAVSGAMFFSVATIFLLSRYWREETPNTPVPFLAGLCAGLAIGSRPDTAPGIAILLAVSVFHVQRTRPRALKEALLILAPFGFVLSGLAAYNWMRFGSILEFGMHYQLTIVNTHRVALASWSYFLENFPSALFSRPVLRGAFPWLDVHHELTQIAGARAGDLMFHRRISIFAGLPINLFALYALWPTTSWKPRISQASHQAVGLFTLSFLFGAATLTTLSFFLAEAPRYVADYALPMTLAASVGWILFWQSAAPRYQRGLALFALACSLYFGLILTHSVWP